MPFYNLNSEEISPLAKADICIIGGGVAGSILAVELSTVFSHVILLEAGFRTPDNSTQALTEVAYVGKPFRENFTNRVRAYGGSCNIWTGRNMVFSEDDLATKSWIPNSGWPIRWSELNTFYQKAAPYLNIRKPSAFASKHWSKGLHSIERSFVQNAELQTPIALWAKSIPRFGDNSALYQKLRTSKNISVFMGANVTALECSEDLGSVSKVKAVSLNGKKLDVEAKTTILATGGLENARLLLLSRQQYPNGIGNEHDNVGRYLMEHPKAVAGTVSFHHPVRLTSMTGRPVLSGKVRLGIALSEEVRKKEKLLNPYLCLSPVTSNTEKVVKDELFTNPSKNPAAKSRMPHALYTMLHYAKNATFPKKVRHYKLMNYCEQAPNSESRVYLGAKKDALGLQQLKVDWRINAQDIYSLERLHYYLKKHLDKHKLGEYSPPKDGFSTDIFADASHHMGTTRMSEKAENGVVDANCKVFGIDNLYIAGSSVFPTSGYANPTLTLVALAIRLADHLKQKQR